MAEKDPGTRNPGYSRKLTFILIGVLVLAAVLMLWLSRPKGTPALVRVYVREELYAEVPVTSYQTLVVDQEDGKVNQITIDREGVHMASSTCKNQICVETGVLRPGAEALAANNWIVCLPNGVSVELAEAQ